MENFKVVMELIAMSVLVNENTEYCSFVDFSGHVEKISIRVFPSKEKLKTTDRLFSVDLYYDPVKTDWKSKERILSEIEDAKKALSGYLYNIDNLEQIESTRP